MNTDKTKIQDAGFRIQDDIYLESCILSSYPWKSVFIRG
jgi:hypothetical protein